MPYWALFTPSRVPTFPVVQCFGARQLNSALKRQE
jgi:hypothetical protein